MIDPWKPSIVNVAVADCPLPVVVNATFGYDPAVYPDPAEVIDPVND